MDAQLVASKEFIQYFGEGFKLKNRTFIVRHGLAESNVKQVMVTSPAVGTTGWGLVDEGKKQAKKAGEKLRELIEPVNGEEILVVSSDFKRTCETAEIIRATLNVQTPLRFDEGLRERYVGDMDLMVVNDTMDPSVFDLWKEDEDDVLHAKHNAESVATVASRMSSVVKAVNQEFQGKIVILVSHQDPLHILDSLFIGLPLPKHRRHDPPIGNCDIKELKTPA